MKAVAEKRVGLTYDAASQAATLSRCANLAGTQVVAHTEYDFDLAGRLRGMEHFKGGTTFADYDWTYDAAGRMTAFDSLVDGTAGYTNDATGQLTGADYDYQADETYVYDDNGNRVNNGYTVGANNQMTSDGTYRYLYDAEGNRTRRFVDANANGLLDSGDTDVTEYTWDHRNRLTEVTHRAAYGQAADMVVENSYDFANRWVRKILDDDGDGTRDYTQVFAYDGNQIVLDFHRNGPCGMEGGHLRERYLWGAAVDQILAEEAVDGGGAENVLWTLTDHLNTVRDLAQYNPGTDSTTVLNHLAYNAFGEVTSETNAAVDSLFLFTARAFDEETRLQNNLNRWYDPAVGRWLSEDPIGFVAADVNLNRYVGNSPLNKTDPTGKQAPATVGDILGTPYREPPTAKGLCCTMKQSAKCAQCSCDDIESLFEAASSHSAPIGRNHCERWADSFLEAQKQKTSPCYTLSKAEWHYKLYDWPPFTWIPNYPPLGHHAVRVTMCDGTVFYFDDGWWSTVTTGAFWPSLIPPTVEQDR